MYVYRIFKHAYACMYIKTQDCIELIAKWEKEQIFTTYLFNFMMVLSMEAGTKKKKTSRNMFKLMLTLYSFVYVLILTYTHKLL